MPRRRMIDPDFWKDHYIATLTRDERLFLLGCMNNADDEGRLEGHPAYLKAAVFMYDDDITSNKVSEILEATLIKMAKWPESNPWRLERYQNSSADYLYFPLWYEHQAPSHPQPSRLPTPPSGPSLTEPFTDQTRQEIYERDNYTCQYCGADLSTNPRTLSIDHIIPLTKKGTHQKTNLVTACKSCNLKKKNKTLEEARMALIPGCKVNPMVSLKVIPTSNTLLTQDSLGQSRSDQVKDSLGQSREVLEDFRPFLDSEKDLTDFLATTLKRYLPRGAQWTLEVLKKFWLQVVGKPLPDVVYEVCFKAIKEHPPPVLARAFVKAAKYKGGKYDSRKYLAKILEEQAGKG